MKNLRCHFIYNKNEVNYMKRINMFLEILPKADGYLKDGDTLTFGNNRI